MTVYIIIEVRTIILFLLFYLKC